MSLLSEKIFLLRNDFHELAENQLIDYDELYALLNKKSGKEFDKYIADQLFERMEKDKEEKVTIEEFIKVFLEAEDILNNKIINAQNYLQQYIQQRQEAIDKLEKAKRDERLNEDGIMVDSFLNVNIIECVDLHSSTEHSNPAVIITYGNQNRQTNVAKPVNPVFNENFTFEVKNRDRLQLQVIDRESYAKNEYLGQILIPIEQLDDQNKHTSWYNLLDKNGDTGYGKIHLSLQWIHSQVKYFADIVNKWDEYIHQQEEDLQEFENDIEIIRSPFSLYKKIQQQNQSASKINISNVQNSTNNHFLTPEEQTQQILASYHQLIKERIRTYIDNFLDRDDTLLIRILLILNIFFLILQFYARPVYLEVVLIFVFMNFWLKEELTISNVKKIIGVWIYSQIIDVAWIAIYAPGYFSGSKSLADFKEVKSLGDFVVVICCIQFIIKTITLVFLVKYVIQQTLEQKEKKEEKANTIGYNPNLHLKTDQSA